MSFLTHPPDSPEIHDEKVDTLIGSTDSADGEKGAADVVINEHKFWQDTPPEVKAVAPEVDDVDEICETLRAYIIGTIVTVVGTGLNVWYGSRQVCSTSAFG